MRISLVLLFNVEFPYLPTWGVKLKETGTTGGQGKRQAETDSSDETKKGGTVRTSHQYLRPGISLKDDCLEL